MKFLTVDPGPEVVGFALFEGEDIYELKEIWTITGNDIPKLSSNLKDKTTKIRDIDQLIIEIPETTTTETSILNAFFGGLVAGLFVVRYDSTIISAIRPSMWRSILSKSDIYNLIISKLRTKELNYFNVELAKAKKDEQYHLIKAVGMGLWKLKR